MSFSSRFHLPAPLGSTVVTRFLATMGTLTPVLLRRAPGQVSLLTELALPDIHSPPTPCAPALAMLLAPGRLGLCFGLLPISGASDFVHCSQSRQSHVAVSSSSCRLFAACRLYRLSVHFQLLSTSPRGDAVTFH